MTVYIDSDYKCHVSPAEGLREIEAHEFEGYCVEYIEGMRLVPEGETWIREDGYAFEGRMVTAWKDYDKLYKAQLEYEVAQLKIALADADAALSILGVKVDA